MCVKSLIFPSDSSGFGKCPLFLLQVFVGDYPEIISAIYIYSIYSLVMLTVKHLPTSLSTVPACQEAFGRPETRTVGSASQHETSPPWSRVDWISPRKMLVERWLNEIVM